MNNSMLSNKSIRLITICLIALMISATATAKNPFESTEEDKAIKIQDMGWTDRNYLEKQVASIDQLAREQLGTEVRQNLSDLDLLQRIIDLGLIKSKDTLALQAMGAVLGNVLAADITALEWKIYEDALGRSRALCAKGSRECLFPITMLSRRMETGLKPDVDKIYEDAIALIDQHLPQLPYGGGTMRKLRK